MDHPTADDIYVEAKVAMPSIAVGTVYRNLRLMADAGDIRRIEVPNAPDRFDHTLREHDHVICVRCGRVDDVDIGNTGSAIRGVMPDMISYDLTIRHLCDSCKKEMLGGN